MIDILQNNKKNDRCAFNTLLKISLFMNFKQLLENPKKNYLLIKMLTICIDTEFVSQF